MFGPDLNSYTTTRGKYPLIPRSCTDVIFAIIFLAFLVVSGAGMIYGLNNGNLENIAQPFDEDGNKCGENNVKDYPLLFFGYPNSTNLKKRATVCVKECPQNNQTNLPCYPNKNVTSCDKLYSYESFPFVDRFCIPFSKDAMAHVKTKIKGIEAENVTKDIRKSWALFLICIAVAFLISAAYCYLLEYCAGFVVTVLIIALLCGLTALGFLFNTKYNGIMNDNDAENDSEFYNYCAIACWSMAGILTLMVCCMWSRIMLAITIIQAAADFVTDYQRLLLVPILNTLALFAYLTLWISTGAYIFSVGESIYQDGQVYGRIVWSTTTKAFWWIHVIALFWVIAFLMYLSHFVIAVAAIKWYFAPNRDNIEDPMMTGYKWGLSYHFGSLAIGSFIIAIIWIVQVTLAYLEQQVQESKAADNKIVKLFLKVAMCLVSCFERFVKYLSKHAFIEVAMRSESFFSGAATAMKLIISNALRLGVLHGLCEIVITFGAFGITACTLIVGFCLMNYVDYFGSSLSSLVGPLVVIAIIGFIVAKLFGHVFSISADTIIHCYLTEENESGNNELATSNIAAIISSAKLKNENLVMNSPVPGIHVKPKQANTGYEPLQEYK